MNDQVIETLHDLAKIVGSYFIPENWSEEEKLKYLIEIGVVNADPETTQPLVVSSDSVRHDL